MMDDFANDTLYQTYKGKGPQFQLISVVSVIYAIGLTGTVFNSSLIYITIKSRNLRRTYHYLLALVVLCDVIYQMGHTVVLVILTTGINFVPLLPCFYIITIPLIGLNGSMIFILLLAMDRLLSVVFPIWHTRLNVLSYLIINIVIGLSYSIYIAHLAHVIILKTPNKPVNCRLSDCSPGYAGQVQFICCLIFNGLTVLCYVCIWIVLQWRPATSSAKSMKRIFKSLAILVAMVVFGWTFNAIWKLILPVFNFNTLQLWYFTQCGGIFVNLASALNVPVLYLFSREYRSIISNELLQLTKLIHLSRTEPNYS
ncbi:serpentine type 7TM GPCR chemoreceptor srsx domain-containing protein [Ditylenchus destructor]|uniref:Serpentine type 7TM GPCR chemoreceptor srsx domain-containing protein n=1 Tax=Ditylenchus destructor TaxID=166010 RepID=A0AAD4QTS9_9BILA|nr:serpentine type 7TM GPCR chemoreceptor srsx domain-containing protein [Ditylenchus destructor]